jgi:AbiTii
MIKQLIKDIAFDSIKISQALTRTKLVENQIRNDTLKKWLTKELEGYEFDDKYLPSYRKIWSTIQLIAELPFGRTHKFSVTLPDSFGTEMLDLINNHRIIEPIAAVENQIENLGDKSKGYINLPAQQTEMLASFYSEQLDQYNGVVRYANREVGKVQYQNVIDQTKQKLIDTLMQLDNEFPTLIDNYNMTKENNDKVQNIVTTNIYGNNNPTNIGVGANVEQHLTNNQLSDNDEKKLIEYGATTDEINELKEIIKSNSKDKPSLIGKAMKWLGTVSASIAAKGLYDNLPMLNDIIHKIIQ